MCAIVKNHYSDVNWIKLESNFVPKCSTVSRFLYSVISGRKVLSDKGTNLECDWKFDQLCACCSKVYCGSPRTYLESRRVGSAGDSSHDGVNANAGAHALRLQGHSSERMVR